MLVSQKKVVTQATIRKGQLVGEIALFNPDGTPFTGGGDTSALAPKASPTFTGDPKAPTPALKDNDTSIATTAFVNLNAGKAKAEIVALATVTAANAAPAAGETPTKAEFAAVVTLVNEMKTKMNAIVTALKA